MSERTPGGRPVKIAHVTTADLSLRFLLLGQLLRLRDEGWEVAGISAPGPWTPDLEARGIRHIPWRRATRSWSPLADVLAFAELIAILRRERFDLVHTHNPKPGILGRVAARLAGVPCVVNTVHGLYATPDDPAPKRFAVLGLERVAAWFSDLELYQSEEDLARAHRVRLARPEKTVLLGNGCDLARFDPAAVPAERAAALRRELGIPQGAPVVGTVGRLVAEKGYRELLAAARRVRESVPEVRILIVGATDPEKADALPPEELEAEGDHVVLAGWREDVRDFLALMDVFVLPSWREGMPRSAIEAAAMGTPLVVTDIRGCREVVRDGIEGLLVPVRDPGRLAAAIQRLLADPELRSAMGAAARERALDRFDERRVAETVAARCRALLEARGVLPAHGPRRSGEVRIRRAGRRDAHEIARLHRESLPGAFLPALGDGFLLRLYRALAEDSEAAVFVAEDLHGVAGFAAGVVSVRRFYRRFVRRHGIRAGLAALPRLARPAIARRALETARYPAGEASLPEAELLAIAVSSGCRTRGVGRMLAEELLGDLARKGAGRVKVVVGAGLEGANRFYARLGFHPAGTIAVHRGEPSNVWVITCRSLSRSG